MDRPSLTRLLADVEQGPVDEIVIYKLDRLTWSLSDFIRLIDLLERYEVDFVSVTQSFDTQDNMGRLVLNILRTFARFEREMLADRIRDKVHAMRRAGRWVGGAASYGYDLVQKRLIANTVEADARDHTADHQEQASKAVKLRKHTGATHSDTAWQNCQHSSRFVRLVLKDRL